MIRSFFSGVRSGMHTFGQNIALIINSAILFVVYWIGVGITALIAKLAKKQFLSLRTDKSAKSYWSELQLSKKPTNEYYRQF